MRGWLLGLICCLLLSCAPTAPSPAPLGGDRPAPVPSALDSVPAPGTLSALEAQAALDGLSAAVLADDRAAFDRRVSHRDASFAATADRMFSNLSQLPLAQLRFSLRPLQQELPPRRGALLGSQAKVWQVAVGWRLEHDVGSAEHLLWFTFLPTAEGATIASTADGPPDRSAQPLWLVDRVTLHRQSRSTVLAAPGSAISDWGRRGDAAAAALRQRLRSSLDPEWGGRLVLEVPSSGQAFEQVLGVAAGSYRQIAAVAWPEGPDVATAAVRILVNPDQVARLDEQALAVLLSHEAVHVATRSAASAAPSWLVEGMADHVAYQAYPRTARLAASALLERVRRNGAPTALPEDAEFSPSAPALPLTYAEAWLACRFLAERYSAVRLDSFYASVSSGTSVEQAARAKFGLGAVELTARWRAYLESTARTGLGK